MRLVPICGIVALALTTWACAEVRSGQVASSVERSAARDLVDQLGAITAQPSAASQLLQAVGTEPILTLALPPGTPLMPLASPATDATTTTARVLTDCTITTGTSTTYDECEVADHVVDGMWSAQGKHIHSKLVDVFFAGPEEHGSVGLDANLTRRGDFLGMRSGALSGSLDLGIMWTADSSDYFLDAAVRVDNLTIEGPHCATSGTVSITAKLGDTALGTTTLWFGPGCQDVQISR
ncbi:MAG: hypothetical protein MJE77_40285 [Proteobacteria bacterium]|nr:hypothetical protein [Pseudomonadota bacterium]